MTPLAVPRASPAPQAPPGSRASPGPQAPAPDATTVLDLRTGPPGLEGLDFVALDVETANARYGSICSIALAVVRGGRVVAVHGGLVRPHHDLAEFGRRQVQVHGITADDVRGAPSFAQRLGEALDVVGDLTVLAHHASFDTGAITQACEAAGLTVPAWRYACTRDLARRALALPGYTLPVVAQALGLDGFRHHDAAADARAAAEVAIALAARHRAGDVPALCDALGTPLRTVGRRR